MEPVFVVIPIFNTEEIYLRTCINSVLKHSVVSHILLVDDGSQERTSKILDRLALISERLLVLHKDNTGVADTRNYGIDNEVDLIGFKSVEVNAAMTMQSVAADLREGFYTGGNDNLWIHAKQHFGAMFYRIGFFKKWKIHFTSGLAYSEDKIFIMECMYFAARICLKDEVLYYYRKHRNSVMGKRKRGIEYYSPIIEEYCSLNKRINNKKNNSDFITFYNWIHYGSDISYGYD